MLRARLLMILGIASLAIGGTTLFFLTWFGIIRFVYGIIPMVAPLLLLWSALMYRRQLGAPLWRGALRLKLHILVLAIVCLALYGLFRGNPVLWIIRDCWPYAVIFCGLLLGRFDRVIEDMEKPLLITYWFCFACTVACLDVPQTISAGWFEKTAAMVGPRASVESVGYKVGDSLGFWPLVFFR